MSGYDPAGYTPEEHAAAWAAYYASQGYDTSSVNPNYVDPSLGASSSASTSTAYNPNAYTNLVASGSSSNPFAQSANSAAGVASAGVGMGMGFDPSASPWQPPAGTQLLDHDLLAQGSVYLPGPAGDAQRAAAAGVGKNKPVQGKRATVIRKGLGKTWEDPTLIDWDPKWYRLFVGDVSNDVNERTIDGAFNKYPTYCKCKVVRDRLSEKAKYAFIAFKDPEDFLKAWKEMDGKYVGNRPIRLSKVRDDKYGEIKTVEVGGRKAKELDKLRKNKGRPLNGRPVPI